MFSASKLLESLPVEGDIEQKKLEKLLKLSKKSDRNKLEIAISAFLKLGLINRDENSNIKRVPDEDIIEARLRCSTKGYCFAIREDGGDDIYIRDHNLNNAWNGDFILVKITREGIRRRSPEGRILCILERNTINILGKLEIDAEKLVASPVDERILGVVMLDNSDMKYFSEEDTHKVVDIKIDKYPIAQYSAYGHVVKKIPLDNGFSGDTDLLLTKLNLQNITDPPKTSLKHPSDKNRVDLTNQNSLIYKSWKGEDSPPIPCIYTESHSGGVRIWLHTPSIAERVSTESLLDTWVRNKGEAICLGDKWIPLLNEQVTKASAFNVGEIKEAISLRMDIDSEGNLKDWEFQLTYIQPKAEINNKELVSLSTKNPKSRTIPTLLKPIKEFIPLIENTIFAANLINRSQLKSGTIQLDRQSPNIDDLKDLLIADPSTNLDVWETPLNVEDGNSILKTIVNYASYAWTKHVEELNLPAIAIEKSNIDPNIINDLAKIAIANELEIHLDDEGMTTLSNISDSFSKSKNPYSLQKLLKHSLPENTLIIYQPSTHSESSINSQDSDNQKIEENLIYCPWCFAGIHYHELINQFILIFLLRDAKSKQAGRAKNKINLGKKGCYKVVDWSLFTDSTQNIIKKMFSSSRINKLNYKRKLVNEFHTNLIAIAQTRGAEKSIGKEVDAIISGVQSYGFFAEIPPYSAEGLVHVSSLSDDWYEYRSRQNKLVGRKSRKTYQLGDSITVKLTKIDILKNQIDLEVIEKANEPTNSLESDG